METATQIPLELDHKPSFDPTDFIVSGANSLAYSALLAWPVQGSHLGVLTGPTGAGKSHLASTWQARVNARPVAEGDRFVNLTGSRFFLLEDYDCHNFDEDQLFHLVNWAKERSGGLLITSRTPPARWDIKLPDLKSRLKSAAVFTIDAPDDTLIMLLLAKLFSDRQIQIEPGVIEYAAARMERSFDMVHALVEAVDHVALSQKRKITLPLVRDYLKSITQSN